MIPRKIQSSIENYLFKGKAILVSGARQTGKTTMVVEIAKKTAMPYLYWNCDEPDIEQYLNRPSSSELKSRIGGHELLIIDEAQRIRNIGITLKLITDTLKKVQLIVTGSSSIGLKDQINEPLTGRKLDFHLHPFCYGELADAFTELEENRLLEQRLIFGMYPDVVMTGMDKRTLLTNLASDYLYKDILALDSVRKPSIIPRLLQAIALQVTGEASLSELGEIAGCDRNTVIRYLDLLEKTFVIFTLPAFSGNQRNEIKKSRKIYFWDNGIRNALLNQFNPLALRDDIGKLWENYMVSEIIKKDLYLGTGSKHFFWRNHNQQEIDLIRTDQSGIDVFEFKWSPSRKVTIPGNFLKSYLVKGSFNINRLNYPEILK